MTAPMQLVLSKLPDAKKRGDRWIARCPAHDDRNPSLSIAQSDDGHVLVKCHAGCQIDAICVAMGITKADLFANRNRRIRHSRKQSTIYNTCNDAVAAIERSLGKRSATWTYKDSDGQPVGVVLRWDTAEGKKTIRPVSRVVGGWRIEAMAAPRPLYGLPELAKADRIIITEGEKAADAARSLGYTSATSAGGSKASSKTDWQPLAGKNCVILPDNDAAGEQYADAVASELLKLTPQPQVRIVALPGLDEGQDLVEFLDDRDNRQSADVAGEIDRLIEMAETCTNAKATTGRHLIVSNMAEVDPRPVQWLWSGYFPKGMFTLLGGDPGLGKSSFMLAVAAGLTRGESVMGESLGEPVGVTVLSSEDSLHHTIAPRLIAANAERSRVYVVRGTRTDGGDVDSFTLAEDLQSLTEHITSTNTQLLIIDPLSAHLGDVQSHNDAALRKVLTPLSEWSDRHSVAVVGIAHLNKNSGEGSPLYRLNGSIANVAAARMAFGVVEHPDKNGRCVLACIKANVAAKPQPICFQIEQALVEKCEVGVVAGVSVFEGDPDELWKPKQEPTPAEEEAEERQLWVSQELEKRGPSRVSCIEAAAEGLYTKSQIRKALQAIKAERRKVGFSSGAAWLWAMPRAVFPDTPPPTWAEEELQTPDAEEPPALNFGGAATNDPY